MKIQSESACRKGVLSALMLAKAFHPELKPELLADGYPQFKVDSSEFTKDEYQAVLKVAQNLACRIARDIDLKKYEVYYDENKKKVLLKMSESFELKSQNDLIVPLSS
ncbi:Cysteine synthase [Hordeum vulgare]|nr:Cysteine synthase [Hordeum vulgare]